MLYPLSYRGTFQKRWHVSTSKTYVKREYLAFETNKKRSPVGATSFGNNER